jgi:hypothetical protein
MKKGKREIKATSAIKAAGHGIPSGTSLQEEVVRFMEYHPVGRLNRNLRKMLLEYLMHESALENFYLRDLLYDLEGLFELLDSMEAEVNTRGTRKHSDEAMEERN